MPARIEGLPRASRIWGRPKRSTAGGAGSRSGPPPPLRHSGPAADSTNASDVLENTRNQEAQRLQSRPVQGQKMIPRPPHPASSCCPNPRIVVVSTCGCDRPHSPTKPHENTRCTGCGKESARCNGSSCPPLPLSNLQGAHESDVARYSSEALVEEAPNKTPSSHKRRNRKKVGHRRKEFPRVPRDPSRFFKSPSQTDGPLPPEAVDEGDPVRVNAMEQNVKDMSIGSANDVFSNNTVLNLTPEARGGHIHQPGVQIFFNSGLSGY